MSDYRRSRACDEPLPIKGIAGGSTTGMAFISANNDAFESYGLRASQIAPVKLEAAVDYANGLNRLLADPATSMKTRRLGPSKIVGEYG
ncbi:type I-C CRISPR-associated protein Cas8c/Csd1 [Deinococcus radiophilus]|uniref:Uncharacterized protein n=1 Tax=Deinococcus radiophilus TaxID=32062 RepID=A0A431VPV4_9DEIO|nr:hypothetical protein EJ104_11860 [Deinococcus radiophilus]